jgi:gluconolactonase
MTLPLSTRAEVRSVIVVDHPDMHSVVDVSSPLERVYSGALWCEGPVWSAKRGALVFSDVRRNTIMALGEHGDATPIRAPSNFANGNAIDLQGRLVTCEHLGRRIVREELDGRIVVLADAYRGRRLNSPNDIAIARDGAVWFTDPVFGLEQPLEGRMGASEQPGRFVFRIDPNGTLDVATDTFEAPNGIVFSPDERTLYISDTSGSDGKEGKREIRAFDVVDGHKLRRERVFATLQSGVPDGLDVDRQGRLYAACEDGVRVWRPDGQALGRISTAATCGNFAFGGADGRMLFVCTGETMHAIRLKAAGAHVDTGTRHLQRQDR